MEKKPVSKKIPVILSIIWLVVGMGVVWYTMPQMIRLEGAFADWNVQMLVFLAQLVFSIGMMIAIRILSVKAHIKWLAILSKVLLIFYCIVGGIALIAFIVVLLVSI